MTWISSSLSIVAAVRPERRHGLAGFLVALLLLLLLPSATRAVAAQATDHGSTATHLVSAAQSTNDTGSKLPKVTIQAARDHALRLKVDHFVTSVAIQPWGDALFRWTKPVCPLVAGLPKAQGEFVLARISKAAIDAHAPLAGRVCSPNLFVVATDNDPDALLKAWWARDRQMYNFQTVGFEAVETFIHSTRPIRVWYNTYEGCAGGVAATSTLATLIGGLGGEPGEGPVACEDILRSRIVSMSTGSDISSAIIVVDGRQMKNVNLGQMADYIAMVGLADLRLDADSTPVPSILQLFGHGVPPQGLTRWDRALLYSLYNTSHRSSSLEMSEMETMMVGRIAP
ncbi:MAG: hypothetical protein ACREUL_14710 [Steroidobacteraceae bacterium]